MDQIQAFQLASNALQDFFNLNALLNAIESIADKYRPVSIAIAFVLLTFGTMRGFLYPETRRFFQNIVRAVILVCLIANVTSLTNWTKQAVQAVANWPLNEQVSLGNLTFNFSSGQRPVEETLEKELAAKVTGSSRGAASRNQSQGSGSLGFIPGASAVLDALNNVKNLAWQILFGLYLLCLLLCKAIIALVSFIQQVIAILFSLYVPIAFGEWAIRSFTHRVQTFLLTYVGLLCWPIGTSFVNVVTLALFKALPSPVNHNIGVLIAAIVAAVPILLWTLIGHVLAPFYIQKMVVRGGAVLQGMLGGIGAGVGLGTAGVFSGLLGGASGLLTVAGGAGLLGLTRQQNSQSRVDGGQTHDGGTQQGANHNATYDSTARGTMGRARKQAGGVERGLIGGLRTAAYAAGQGMTLAGGAVERLGDVTATAGEGVADAADPGITPSLGRRISRPFGLASAYARSYRTSSDRARKYLD
jgi:hypothetical protein